MVWHTLAHAYNVYTRERINSVRYALSDVNGTRKEERFFYFLFQPWRIQLQLIITQVALLPYDPGTGLGSLRNGAITNDGFSSWNPVYKTEIITNRSLKLKHVQMGSKIKNYVLKRFV